jgi:predicted O-linked N-acetylglucosamine transferase (SPINDLY family)
MASISVAFTLATVHYQAGRLDLAEELCRRIVAAEPQHAEAWELLGTIALQGGRPTQAIDYLRRALALQPEQPVLLNSLGNLLADQGGLDEAVACYERALAQKPTYDKAWYNLGHTYMSRGRPGEAVDCYRRAAELSPRRAQLSSTLLHALHFCPGQTGPSIVAEHRRWMEPLAQHAASLLRPYANDRTPDRRLRIGYVSPDFRQHAVGFNVRPLFERRDRGEAELFCYAGVARPDAMTERLRACADVWRNTLGLSDAALAQQIRDDRIDVLVDLALHTNGNRLGVFARRPAPVQVTFAGYPGTTGLAAIDYRLTDPYLDPPGSNDAHYAEQSWRLPRSFWCYWPLGTEPAVGEPPFQTQGGVTFGCLNSFRKVNEEVLRLWARVLGHVEGSQLLLLTGAGAHRDRVRELFAAHGVAPDRVTFVAPQPRQQYLALYQRIDVALDPFPYNGHTTSLDALWMGVPVVSLVGTTAVGRAGLSILTNAGLPELAAADADQYAHIAAALAAARPRLAELHATLRARLQQSPLTDAAQFARGVEAAYRQMWCRWCAATP